MLNDDLEVSADEGGSVVISRGWVCCYFSGVSLLFFLGRWVCCSFAWGGGGGVCSSFSGCGSVGLFRGVGLWFFVGGGSVVLSRTVGLLFFFRRWVCGSLSDGGSVVLSRGWWVCCSFSGEGVGLLVFLGGGGGGGGSVVLFFGCGSVVLSRTVGLLFCLGVGGSVVLSQGVGLLFFLGGWVCCSFSGCGSVVRVT